MKAIYQQNIQQDKFQYEIRIDLKGEINMNNYRIISDIGSGAYSTVHKAIDVNTGHIVAIKKISEQSMNIKHIINREVAFLHKCLNHPNIIQLYKCFSIGTFTYLVFQYMPMDLISYYKSVQQSRKRNLNDQEISCISFQLCNALQFLHQKGIMHRDIKPENILIDPDTLTVKLIDFGFAKISDAPLNTNYMVTRWYRPLEIVLNLPYNQKVDVFATGALILQLYLGNQIFRSSSNIDQFYWIANICGNPPNNWTKAQQAITRLGLNKEQNTPQLKQMLKNIRPLAADLINKMLKTSPYQRISMNEATEHPYFSRFKIKNVQPFNKHHHLIHRPIDFTPREEGFRNPAIKRNRALSTQQQHHLSNTLASRLQSNMTQASEDSNSNQLSSLNSEPHKSTTNEPKQHIKIKTLQSLTPRKHFIRRVSAEKNDELRLKVENLKSKQLFTDKNNRLKPQERIRNRVRSMNTHGINVVSLKKLKVHREIERQKSKGKGQIQISKEKQQESKGKPLESKNEGQTIKLNPRREKEKPMFLRVKQKINQGRINQRGQDHRQSMTVNSERKSSNFQISTKICSSAQLKIHKISSSKQHVPNE